MKKKQRKKRHDQEELTLSKALVIADKQTYNALLKNGNSSCSLPSIRNNG